MTRINHILALVTLTIMHVSTGCGDAGSFDEAAREDTGRIADDAVSTGETTPSLDEELELACEGLCETSASCEGRLAGEGCAERCARELGPEADDACIAAQIDVLNCLAGTTCEGAESVRAECGGAIVTLRGECGPSVLRRERDEDGELEVIEIGDGEWADVVGDPEEAESSGGSGEEEPDEPEEGGPSFELPEIPDYPEVPEIGPVIELP